MSAVGLSLENSATAQKTSDPVGNVLKWTLLAVAVVTFALLGLTTKLTYQGAPPIPAQVVGPDGTVLMSAADVTAGKSGPPR